MSRHLMPCIDCGGPKEPLRGGRRCAACREATAVKTLCQHCGGPKPPGQGRRLCEGCTPDSPIAPCFKCGSTAPKSVRGRRLCDDCQPVDTEAATARRRARRAMGRKPCERCGKQKGPGRCIRLCPACRAESQQQQRTCYYCPTPVAKYKRVCPVCQETARRENWKRYDELRRAAPAKPVDEIAQRRATKPRKSTAPLPERIKTLPSAPLAAALEKIIRRESASNLWTALPGDGGARAAVCARAGIDERRLFRLANESDRVQFVTADGIVTRAGLAWWEVWPEGSDGYAEAAHLFGGEELAA